MTIIKRDGRKVDFDRNKIIKAVLAAFDEVDDEITPEARRKATVITNHIESLNKKSMNVEDIQDIIETMLMDGKRKDVAKAFVIYRNDRTRVREQNTNLMKSIKEKLTASVLMIHQVIAEIKYGEYESSNSIPDRLSRDTDDNRKCNIILKSNQRNSHNRGLSKVNTSGKTGVSYNKEKNMWTAYITVNYKTKYLGDYADFNDAVNARKGY